MFWKVKIFCPSQFLRVCVAFGRHFECRHQVSGLETSTTGARCFHIKSQWSPGGFHDSDPKILGDLSGLSSTVCQL